VEVMGIEESESVKENDLKSGVLEMNRFAIAALSCVLLILLAIFLFVDSRNDAAMYFLLGVMAVLFVWRWWWRRKTPN
jgi:lipopolysaccharide export LptBFGC system permease protein LptF